MSIDQLNEETQKIEGSSAEAADSMEKESGGEEKIDVAERRKEITASFPQRYAEALDGWSAVATPEEFKDGMEKMQEIFNFGKEEDKNFFDKFGGKDEFALEVAKIILTKDNEGLLGRLKAAKNEILEKKRLMYIKEGIKKWADHGLTGFNGQIGDVGRPMGEQRAWQFIFSTGSGHKDWAEEDWNKYLAAKDEQEEGGPTKEEILGNIREQVLKNEH